MDGSLAYVWESAKGSRIELEQREGNTDQLDNDREDPLSFWLEPPHNPLSSHRIVFLSHLHLTDETQQGGEIPQNEKFIQDYRLKKVG